MKERITMRYGKQISDYVILDGKMQNLLRYRVPFAYSAGKYGWNCDYYEINYKIIAVGPRTPNLRRLDDATVRTFDEAARGKNEEETEKILEEFMDKVHGWWYVEPWKGIFRRRTKLEKTKEVQ